MNEKTRLENEIQSHTSTIDRIKVLQAVYKNKAEEAQNALPTLNLKLSEALARSILGETDHAAPEILKAEIAKAEAIIKDAPLIEEGLLSRASAISAECKTLRRELNRIAAQEAFDQAKAAIMAKADRGVYFQSEAAQLRHAARDLGIDVNEFIREMTKVYERKTISQQTTTRQPVNQDCQPCPR